MAVMDFSAVEGRKKCLIRVEGQGVAGSSWGWVSPVPLSPAPAFLIIGAVGRGELAGIVSEEDLQERRRESQRRSALQEALVVGEQKYRSLVENPGSVSSGPAAVPRDASWRPTPR
jgi:hypothetical protein